MSVRDLVCRQDAQVALVFVPWSHRRELPAEWRFSVSSILGRPVRSGSAAVWLVVSGVLVIALATAPAAVAGWGTGTSLSVTGLPSAVAEGFTQWMQSGRMTGTTLAVSTSFWMVFHLVKALVAAALLVTVIPVGIRIWGAYARTDSRGRRILLWLAGVVGAPAVPLLVLMVMANVQGVVAPLSSVLNFLPLDTPAVTDVRTALAAGQTTPALSTLTNDFRLYHAALVVCAVIAVLAVVGATVVLWVRRARTPREQRRLRRVLAAGGMIVPMFLLILGVVLLANASTVADTTPALVAFFEGSGT